MTSFGSSVVIRCWIEKRQCKCQSTKCGRQLFGELCSVLLLAVQISLATLTSIYPQFQHHHKLCTQRSSLLCWNHHNRSISFHEFWLVAVKFCLHIYNRSHNNWIMWMRSSNKFVVSYDQWSKAHFLTFSWHQSFWAVHIIQSIKCWYATRLDLRLA